MSKRSWMIVVVVLLMVTLAACSGGKKAEPTPTPIPTVPPAKVQPTPTKAAVPTKAPKPTEAAKPSEGKPAMGDASAALSAALEAAKAKDWDKATTELNEALDLVTDPEQKATIEEILSDIEKGKYDEVVEDLEKLVSAAPGESPVMGFLEEALDAAKAKDWDKAKEELEEALDVSTDAEQKATIEEILSDIEKGKYDEVVEDLEKLVSAAPGESPVMGFLEEALDAAKAKDWDKAKEELEEALDVSTDAEQKATIEEILSDIEKGKYDEVVEDLEKLIAP